MIRWLDYNDTWLAAEWGHPSDNLGTILSVADYRNRAEGQALTMHDVLEAMCMAYEIQGVIALEKRFQSRWTRSRPARSRRIHRYRGKSCWAALANKS